MGRCAEEYENRESLGADKVHTKETMARSKEHNSESGLYGVVAVDEAESRTQW
jgi:hypothetical protein